MVNNRVCGLGAIAFSGIALLFIFLGVVVRVWIQVDNNADITNSDFAISYTLGSGANAVEARAYTQQYGLWQSCTRLVPVDPNVTIQDDTACAYTNTNCQAQQCWWVCTNVFNCGTLCTVTDLPPAIVNCAGYVSTRIFATISLILCFIGWILSFLIIANRQPSGANRRANRQPSGDTRIFGMAMLGTFLFGMIAWAVAIGTNFNTDSVSTYYNIEWAQILFITGTVLAFFIAVVSIGMAGKVKNADENNNNFSQNPNNNQMEMQPPKQYGDEPPPQYN